MLEIVQSILTGFCLFAVLFLFTLRLVLEKLIQRNYQFIDQWEALKTKDKVVNIDKEKRQRKGLGHRRRGKDTMGGVSGSAKPVLLESMCEYKAGGKSGECFAELKIGQISLYDDIEVMVGSEAQKSVILMIDLLQDHEVKSMSDLELKIKDNDEGFLELRFPNVPEKTKWESLIQNMTMKKHSEAPKEEVAFDEFESASYTAKKRNIPFDKMDGVPNACAEFLNRILWRYFQEMATIHLFEEYLGEKINLQLKKKVAKSRQEGKYPWFIDDIKYKHVIKGETFIKAHQIKVDKVLEDGTLLMEADAEYSGGAGVVLTTKLLLPGLLSRFFGDCEIEIRIQLIKIRATVFIFMPRDFSEKFSLCFQSFPDKDLMEFDMEVYVGKNRLPLVCQSEILERLAQSIVMRLMCHALVYPSSLRFFLPYPGRKPQGKIQKYLTQADVEKKRKAKAKNAKKKNQGPVVSNLTMKQISDAKKLEQRRKAARLFFEQVMVNEDHKYVQDLCDDNFEVFGFSDLDLHTTGASAFFQSLADLKRRFQNFSLEIDSDVGVEEGENVVWSIRGVQLAKVWNKMPPSTPGINTGFRGASMFYFDSFGKIVGIEFFFVVASK